MSDSAQAGSAGALCAPGIERGHAYDAHSGRTRLGVEDFSYLPERRPVLSIFSRTTDGDLSGL